MEKKDINVLNIPSNEKIEIEFYSYEEIFDDLKAVFGEELVKSYDMTVYAKWSQIRKDNTYNAHYFTYIKFFVENDNEYGLVGGKTTYNNPDVLFDEPHNDDNRIARLYLKRSNLNWSTNIIVIHHKKAENRNADNMLAVFIERYVQRKYHLFDS